MVKANMRSRAGHPLGRSSAPHLRGRNLAPRRNPAGNAGFGFTCRADVAVRPSVRTTIEWHTVMVRRKSREACTTAERRSSAAIHNGALDAAALLTKDPTGVMSYVCYNPDESVSVTTTAVQYALDNAYCGALST